MGWAAGGNIDETTASRESWLRRCAERERLASTYGLGLLLLIVPLWGVVDLLLVPELAPTFLAIRAVACAVYVGVHFVTLRLNRPNPEHELRARRALTQATLAFALVSTAWMLPPQSAHFHTYLLGFSLLVWGGGFLYGSHGAHVAISLALTLISVGGAYLAQGTSQSLETLLGAAFYLIAASLISTTAGVMQYRDQRSAHVAQWALRAERERDQLRYRMAVKGLGVGLWEWNAHTKHTLITPQLGSLFGLDLSEVSDAEAKQLQSTLMRTVDRERLATSLRRVVSTRQEESLEVELFVDTARAWFRVWVIAEFDGDRLLRVIGAVQDISPQKLRDARKTMFVATMSHELRTPLNGILGMADLMDDSGLPDRYRERLRTIQFSGEHMLSTINDVLDFAKIEANAMNVTMSTVDLRAVVASTMSILRSQVLARPLDVSSWVDADVPERIRTDGARLSQVLVNLVGNALKFTERGFVRVRVTRPPGGDVQIAVSDSGIGIPADQVISIFTPFERVESARNRTTEGQGLGLAIGHRIVSLLGGRLSCTSTVDVGSEFAIHLDCDLPVRAHVPQLSGRHVVVVGLQEDTADVANMALVAEGTDVTVLADLSIEPDLPRPPDAMVLPLGSLDVFRQSGWARTWPQMKIVFVSRGSMLFEDTASVASGVIEYPLDPNALINVVRLALETTRPQPARSNEPPLADLCPLRIGIAEDDPVNRRVTVALLQREGYDVQISVDGTEALEMVESGCLDLVLMDLHMPRVDGMEATRRIRSSMVVPCQPHIVAFSADVTQEARTACLGAGMDDVLRKPARRRELQEMLQRSYDAIELKRR